MSIVLTKPFIPTYSDIILADSPLHYWRLGEALTSSPAVDEVGTTNGVYEDTPTLGVTGLIANDADTAMQTRGTIISQLGEGMRSSAHIAVSGDFSLECWYKNTGVHQEAGAALITQYDNNDGFLFYVSTATGFLNFSGKTGGGAYRSNVGSTDVDDGFLHHIVAVNNSNVAEIWIDGVQDTMSVTNNFLGDLGGNSNFTKIGYHRATSAPDLFPLNGILDEVAIYNVALSGAQVGVHHTAGV